MRIVALVESVGHVCERYRISAFAPIFADAGHSLELVPLARGTFQRAFQFRGLRSADIVILQRKLLPQLDLVVLRQYAQRLIFDFDDAIFGRDSYSTKGFASSGRQSRFTRTARLADVIVAGNDHLAAEARRLEPQASVVRIPTCVNPANYPIATHTRKPSVRFVWVGSASTLQAFSRIRPILDAIGQAIRGSTLAMICDRFMTFDHLQVEPIAWSELSEAEELARCDIGIAWMPDDPWSRGKCGLKVLQYQAAGLPVIANPVGVHTSMVRANETGFTATTTEEWVSAAVRLAESAVLRQKLGDAGRRQTEVAYSIGAGGQLWLQLLDRLAGATPLRGVA